MENKENIIINTEDDKKENSETEMACDDVDVIENHENENDSAEEEHAIENNFSLNGEDSEKVKSPFVDNDYVNVKDYPSLLNNPFLYNLNNSNNVQVRTIEEFAIKYKKGYVYLGSVAHNDKIDKKVKLKLVKKSFKKWKKNFNDNYLDAVGNVSSAIETMEITPVKTIGSKFKITLFIFALLELLPILIFINSKLEIIDVELIMNASNNVYDMFNSEVYIKLMFLLPAISLILMILIGLIYKVKSHKFRKLKKKAERFSMESSKEIKKCFKRTYKKVFNYYLNNIKSNDLFYEAMKIEDVICNKCDVTEIEELIVEAVKKATNQRKLRNRVSIINKILLTLFIIGVIASIAVCVVTMFM